MTNFDFLKTEEKFAAFADVAIAAEKILAIDPAACALNCRRALEAGIKWMYSVDASLALPWDDKLVTLMNAEDFRDIVDDGLWVRMDFIRKTGNAAAHSGRKIGRDRALLCLENLFYFMDFLAYCYGDQYQERAFDPALAQSPDPAPAPTVDSAAGASLEDLIKENAALKAQLTARRQEQKETYVPKPLDLSEYQTRKVYIDAMLEDAGWVRGRDWLEEVEVTGMPSGSGRGYADYVLSGDDGRPLALVEAKRTCADPAQGRQQAKLYADCLEKQYGRRPVIFLTNGFDTRILDGRYPERRCAAIYSKRDLEKHFNLASLRTGLASAQVDRAIAGRYYQEAAIRAVCDSFDRKNRRKALLVMATGSGKTRTVIALVKVLQEAGWIRDVLFLADRSSLVTQAKRSFVNLLPTLSVTNLVEEKDNTAAHCVFSTYQTMIKAIDSLEDDQGRVFTCGHFDLVICDEAHRSIYNKYKDIFTYFDAPLVGLTATPKDEVDKNTYEIFQLETGVPTYAYDLDQAVKDGYLVDFTTVETKTRLLDQGIVYDDLTQEEKEIYEKTFAEGDGSLPDSIAAAALNAYIFNADTIRQVLAQVMDMGLKIDYGAKLGKTIIFAKNHNHAEKILEIFNQEYPHLAGYAQVIDNYMTYAQAAIDAFSDPDRLPQIAISVDMLDTGIDVPEILNLVFFKKVMSKAKFWQMIGRGTRLCPGLVDGADKTGFIIFDYCGNFDFFRMHKGKATGAGMTVQAALFWRQFQIAFKLQDARYRDDQALQDFRAWLVSGLAAKVRELNRDNFAVRQHLKWVDTYAAEENYAALTFEDTQTIKAELAPLVLPGEGDASALRFDTLIFGLELAMLDDQQSARAKGDLLAKAAAIGSLSGIPEIQARQDLIDRILHTDYLDKAGLSDWETIRQGLRDLMKYLPKDQRRYDTNFEDQIIEVKTGGRGEMPTGVDLRSYRQKAEYYVRQHPDEPAIHKLRNNIPLSGDDIRALEDILWKQLGSREDYEEAFGPQPLGLFVRSIVGLDMKAAKEAFADFLDETRLNSSQIYFVNQIVEFIVRNGAMTDLSVLQDPPFNALGSVVDLFPDLTVWMGIRRAIEAVNANAAA